MRIRRTTKFKLLLFLIIAFAGAGFFMAYNIYKPSKETSAPWIVPNLNIPSKKFISRETIVNQFQSKQELIPLEVELTEKITIDSSLGNLQLLKKTQNIYFVGKGIYTVDLSLLSIENVIIDNDTKLVSITSPNPSIKTISMEEQKTIYETPETGLFRFGEVKLTPSEFQSMLSEAKIKMTEKMSSSELYNTALKSTEAALRDFVMSILHSDSSLNYSVIIQFDK